MFYNLFPMETHRDKEASLGNSWALDLHLSLPFLLPIFMRGLTLLYWNYNFSLHSNFIVLSLLNAPPQPFILMGCAFSKVFFAQTCKGCFVLSRYQDYSIPSLTARTCPLYIIDQISRKGNQIYPGFNQPCHFSVFQQDFWTEQFHYHGMWIWKQIDTTLMQYCSVILPILEI